MTLRILFILLILIVIPHFSFAKNKETLCHFYFAHQPTDSVAYVPGVDVHGNAVVPADLNASVVSPMHDKIVTPVTIDLAKMMGIKLPTGTEMNAAVALLEIFSNGRVTYNGQDVSDNVDAFCNGDVKTPVVENITAPDVSGPDTPIKPSVTADVVTEKPVTNGEIIWGEAH